MPTTPTTSSLRARVQTTISMATPTTSSSRVTRLGVGFTFSTPTLKSFISQLSQTTTTSMAAIRPPSPFICLHEFFTHLEDEFGEI
jgi:hypothetical protein